MNLPRPDYQAAKKQASVSTVQPEGDEYEQ